MIKSVSAYIDHTLLKATCNSADIDKLCREAIEFGFAAVCVPPFVVKQAAEALRGSPVKTATVVGFPLGYSCLDSKIIEIETAISDGADELDTVINFILILFYKVNSLIFR